MPIFLLQTKNSFLIYKSMKHLKKFENFSEIEKNQYDNITSNKEDLENSPAFDEMPDNEQEILSDAYSKESENIESEVIENSKSKYRIRNFNREFNLKQLTENSSLDELFGQSINN